MNNANITTFEFTPALVLRAINIDGEPWFIAKDVCDVLELANPRSSLALLDEDEKAVHSVDTLGGAQGTTLINESGLYSLILKSRKPEAKTFKKWVTSVVLPSIRKTGTFSVQAKSTLPPIPQDYLSALKELITSIECQAALKVENKSLKDELVVRVDVSKWMSGAEIRAKVGIHGRLGRDHNIAFANEMDDIAKGLGVPTHIKDVNGTTFYATNVFHPEAAKVWIERHPLYQRRQLPATVTNHVVLPTLRH